MTPRESVDRFFTGFYAGDAAATREGITDDFTLIGPFVAANSAAEFFQLAQGLLQIVRGHRVLRWVIEGSTVAALYEIDLQGPGGVAPLTTAGWFDVGEDGRLIGGQLLYDRKAFDAIVTPG